MSSDKTMGKLFERVREMNWDELRTRGRHEIAKRCDRVRSILGKRFIGDHDSSAQERCGHFFFEQADIPSILDFLRHRLPDVVEEIVHQADQICRHRFDLLGYRDVDHGSTIDWHLDAVHGKRAPLRAWYKVPYLDFDKVGDSKITWELNRHQHLVTLAKAYHLTGRSQFAVEVFEQWYDWQRQNPYPIGINWASSLEVAFRSLSWLWISHLLDNCSVCPAGFPSDLRRALTLNGRHIARFPSTFISPNTHLLGEGAGLFFIGSLCPGPAAELWQRAGWQIVLREAERQVGPDGMHFEHSTYYHTYALDFFLHARVLASLNGIPIPIGFDKTIEKMLEAIVCLSGTGSLPRLGDDDGGRLFDPRRNRLEQMLDPLALGAIVFNRSDFRAAAGQITEEAIWLSGPAAVIKFVDSSGDRPARASFALEPSGIYVMATPEPLPQQFVVDVGPSAPGRQGHRHADMLSAQLTLNGRAVLVDSGTFGYVSENGDRVHFRRTAAHNSARVDGLSQAEPDGAVKGRGLSRADVNHWVIGSRFDFFEGSHSGYRRLPDPVEHRRSIFYLKPHFWLVRDVLSGSNVHQVDVQWHFSKGNLRTKGNEVTFAGNNQAALSLLFASNHPWTHNICTRWHSQEYGRKESSPVLRSMTKAVLPVELVTLLIPTSTTGAKFEVRESLAAESGTPLACAYTYTLLGGTEHLFVFRAAAGNWKIGPWSSDARFLFCANRRGGKPDCFVMCNGRYLAYNGRQVLVARGVLDYAEFFFDGYQPQFRSSNPDAVCVNPASEADPYRSPLS
jgi:hypothetical protein